MSKLFPNTFSPLEIRGKTFKNRLYFAPHGTGYAENGKVGGQGYEYYKARVTNGISLLISEATQVVPLPGQKYAQLSAASDDCIPHFKQLADLCRENDCRYFVQLFHYGRAYPHSLDGSKPVALGPSAMPDERNHTMPRALKVTEIEDLVRQFGEAAGRAYKAGADGAQILVGMGYLHAQFLSPRVNIRTDAYGGSVEGRSLFLRQTLRAMREETDDDFIIGIRIAGEEYDPDGLRLEDTLSICQLLEKEQLVDYLDICAASTHTLSGTSHIVPPMFVDTGQTLPYSEAIKKAVSVPVFTCGRINQPQDAERAVANGQTDMVGMVRAFITDPEFVTKAQQDRPDDIRACIACNQACIGHRLIGHGVSCIQYPETGREIEYGTKKAAASVKRVAIVGGGPAGMKAAVVAAQRGHDVTLYEKTGKLGGQAILAQMLPGRAEFGGLITNLQREIDRYGVKVQKNSDVTAETILQDKPDAVVVATGAVPRIPKGEFEDAHIVTAWDVISGSANVGSRVIIADWRCDWIGLGVAEKLAAAGCAVTLAVNGEMAGQSIQPYVRYMWQAKLHSLGVRIVPYMRLFGADSDTVYLQHVVSNEPFLCEEIETLVLAYGHDSVTTLQDELEGKVEELHAIGDCVSPRTAEEAVLDGLKIGSIL